MQIDKKELDDLYGLFAGLQSLRQTLQNGGTQDVALLDEILKLRAEVEKLKVQTHE